MINNNAFIGIPTHNLAITIIIYAAITLVIGLAIILTDRKKRR